MSDDETLIKIDGPTLAAAFPNSLRSEATTAGIAVAQMLAPVQRTDRFVVQVEGQHVLLPRRLHFASDRLPLKNEDNTWRLARALQTRGGDGFERQLAARDLLANLKPCEAPFIVALIGEYVVEILDDIFAAMTPGLEQTLRSFIADNQAYWATTKKRVTSYWNEYYRARWLSDLSRAERHDEYVGFKLIQQLEKPTLLPG